MRDRLLNACLIYNRITDWLIACACGAALGVMAGLFVLADQTKLRVQASLDQHHERKFSCSTTTPPNQTNCPRSNT